MHRKHKKKEAVEKEQLLPQASDCTQRRSSHLALALESQSLRYDQAARFQQKIKQLEANGF